MSDDGRGVVSVYDEAAALRRICRVLLQQVKRGGPSNFEQVASHYLEGDDLLLFQDLVEHGPRPGSGSPPQ